MKVSDIMSASPVTVAPDETALHAARLLSRHNVGSLPVCGTDGSLRGVVTDRDIVLRQMIAGFSSLINGGYYYEPQRSHGGAGGRYLPRI